MGIKITGVGKLQELEERKIQAETSLANLTKCQAQAPIDEALLRQLLGQFRQYVKERDILEVKNFISNYIKQVIVSKDHVGVVFFLSLGRAQQSCNLLTGESPVQVTTKGPGSYKTSVNRDGDVEASRKSVNEV